MSSVIFDFTVSGISSNALRVLEKRVCPPDDGIASACKTVAFAGFSKYESSVCHPESRTKFKSFGFESGVL